MKTKNSNDKKVTSVRIEPRTSNSKSSTLLSELTGHVLLRGIFKFLFMHHLIFGLG